MGEHVCVRKGTHLCNKEERDWYAVLLNELTPPMKLFLVAPMTEFLIAPLAVRTHHSPVSSQLMMIGTWPFGIGLET